MPEVDAARRADLWTGLAIAAAGATLFWLTLGIRETEEGIVGPRFVPQVVTALMALGGLALAAASRRGAAVPSVPKAPDPRPNAAPDPSEAPPSAPLRAMVVPVLGLGYVALLPLVGYLAATFAAAWAALVLFGGRPRRTAPIAAGLALALHAAFALGMGLHLPRGRLLDLAALWG